MTDDNAARGAASRILALALASFAGACGGGGSAAPPAAGAAPPPSAPPTSAPAPTPSTPASPASTDAKPLVELERDPDGTTHLRVTEQAYSPFGADGAAKQLLDKNLGPAPGSNNVIEGSTPTLVSKVAVTKMKYGLTLQQSGTVLIDGYSYRDFAGGGSIYGGAIKLGDNDRPTDGPTFIQRVVADGMQTPDATYKVSNNDFLGVEEDSGPIYVRGVTGRNFGDAGIDTKSTQVYVMNATLEGAHRILRAWPGVEIILVNSIINAPPDHAQAWVGGPDATIRYYNTLWCQNAKQPTAKDANCRTAPWAVEGEDLPFTVAAARIIPLSSNPLPGQNAFFQTRIDQIVVEYSKDGGAWTALQLPNAGGPGSAPIGDTRYAVPLNLNDGTYRFRASVRLNGVQVGATSSIIDENGQTIS